jgi:hypothetical protein
MVVALKAHHVWMADPNRAVSCTLQGGKARKAHGSDDDSDEDFGAAKKAPKKKAAPKKAEVRVCVMRLGFKVLTCLPTSPASSC